ncbi:MULTISPECIES: hypothetical protein [Streptomyces]|uniref:hypothetical protein n=1 Tax=Streptomyces TaxID=1883 RepID=UPI000998B1AC|nr:MULTISPECIES: hypothetical protein [Streptomyces]
MGLTLYPGSSDVDDVESSWSYSGFDAFRNALAAADGIDLQAMQGFGGDRPWSTVTSPLGPLLDHPDDRGQLSVAECEQVLPRLSKIVADWAAGDLGRSADDLLEDASGLVAVLEVCVREGAPMVFS